MDDFQENTVLVEVLESRHRKEKKELQAQIQALKKAGKNDKTKKKELTAEIAKLELDMETRHKQELEAITPVPKESSCTDDVDEINNTVGKCLKISKAQRRREKKSQQEKQREKEIKLQEQDNLHGPRNLEMQAISSKLKEMNLKMFLIPSDGDCLYNAVAHQLELKKQVTLSTEALRKKVALNIYQNKEEFIAFMTNPDTSEMLSDEEFVQYCDRIENSKMWGGQLEIKALSSSLKCPITIVQAINPFEIKQGSEFDGPPLIITYHRHMYSLGEHYNSTCELTETEENE